MSKVLLCSDTHFGHRNITKYRFHPAFSSPEEHDAFVAERILSTVSKRDNLWILGDICFSNKSFHYIEAISRNVSRLNLILGNHDFEQTKAPSVQDYLHLGNVKLYGMVKYKGFWLSHAPIHPAELRGKKNIHGHVHSETLDDPRYINVCMEELEDFRPVNFQTIKANHGEKNV